MFKFLLGAVETVAKTAVALPISVVADVVTLGGDLSDKAGQSYTGDAIDSISDSIDKMND